ncbi:Gfo/Idh/MocA family oxidoreductase [Pseudalkalibacillus sp. SCS-8]|uniref:Gfo/Idh/MocA family protein n=1 Tax=Pseudalkalibacillus nanhaiensis TaxID=3115291 RepID=UPI0032DB3863
MEPIRVAVIGAGAIAQVGHLPYYQQHPDVVISCIVDPNEARALEMARLFEVEKTYDSVSTMLASEKIDAASICTPNVTHLSIARMLLEKDVHILVEKPLGIGLKEAEQVVKLAAERSRVCMVAMSLRFRNDVQLMKQLIEKGNLGDIYYAKARYMRRRGTPAGWFTDSSLSGGGAMMDIGVHILDLAWWLLGMPKPTTISGYKTRGLGNYQTQMTREGWTSAVKDKRVVHDVEDFGSAFIRFDNRCALSLETAWAMQGKEEEGFKLDIYGTKGGLSVHPLCFYHEMDDLLMESYPKFEMNDPLNDQIDHFIQSIKSGENPLSDGTQGLNVLRMLDWIDQSNQSGKEITC